METTRLKIISDGTSSGTKIFFISDGKEAEIKNCSDVQIRISAAEQITTAVLTLFNTELKLDGYIHKASFESGNDKTEILSVTLSEQNEEKLEKLSELAKAFDSVNGLWVTSVMDLQRTGQRTESQSLQSEILSERLKEIDSEILKISPVRDSPHMCDTCIYDMAVCGSKSIIYAIDMYPNLRGTDADRVIECGRREQPIQGFAA